MLDALPTYCDVPKEEMDISPPQAKYCGPSRTTKIRKTTIEGWCKMMPTWAPLRTRSQHMVGFGYSWSSDLQASGLCHFFPPGSPVLAIESLSGLLPWQTVRLLSFFSSSSILSTQNVLVGHLSAFLLSDLHNSCGVSRPFNLLNLVTCRRSCREKTCKAGLRKKVGLYLIEAIYPQWPCHFIPSMPPCFLWLLWPDLTLHCIGLQWSRQIWFQESQTPVEMDKMILYLT